MSWAETINLIRESTHESVLSLRCPVCGEALKIEAVQLRDKSAIYVDCKSCGESARSSSKGEAPEWVSKLGNEIVTRPEP